MALGIAVGTARGDPSSRSTWRPPVGSFRSTSTTPIPSMTRPIPVGSALSSSTKGGGFPSAPRPVAAPAAGGGSYPSISGSTQIAPRTAGELDRMRSHLDSISRGPDPRLQTQVDRLGERLSTDTTDRAINRASDSIRDQAAAQKAALAPGLASRGFGAGSGVGQQAEERIDARAQRAQAGAAADITMADVGRRDALTLGGQQIMAAPGQYGLARDTMLGGQILGSAGAATEADRTALGWAGQGLEAYKADRGFDLAERDQGMAQWLGLMRMFQ